MGPPERSEAESPPQNGWARLFQQELQVQDPQNGGQAARICPDDIALVYVDDELIETATEVFERTHISISTPFRTNPEYDCNFEIAEDLCSVTLTVHCKKRGSFFELPDTEPALETRIKVLEVPAELEAFVEDIGAEIYDELLERKISNGILPDKIREAIENPDLPVIVVKSPSPKAGINRLKDLYALPEPRGLEAQNLNLSYPVLKACKAGEDLVLREVLPSQAGVSVFGEPVVPPQVEPPKLQALNSSVEIAADQNSGKARIEGLPCFLSSSLSVLPFSQHKQDLVGGPGKIYDLDGALQVEGHIGEGARIWAQHHVEVQGNVNHAHIESQGSVIVHGNSIKAQIFTGGDAAACLRLLTPVKNLFRDMRLLKTMLREVLDAARGSAPSERKILQRLIKTQFPKLMSEVDGLWSLNKSLHQLHPRRTMVLKVVLSNLMNLNERQVNLRIFQDWLDRLQEFIEDLEQFSAQSAHAYLAYAQGSDIVSTGNIYILAEGCYNSALRAGGDIYFCGDPGYCREGYMELQGNLYARELGSPNGSRLQIQLAPKGQIFAELIHPGVEFRFGQLPWEHVVDPLRDCEIFLNGGEIINRPRKEPENETLLDF